MSAVRDLQSSEVLSRRVRDAADRVNALRNELAGLAQQAETVNRALAEAESLAAGLSAELITSLGYVPRGAHSNYVR
jgi:cell division septum initiation protein DivIVA